MKKIIVTATVLTLLLTASSAIAATNDYVNYWTMDEGTGRSVNDSVGGQNGVMTGTSTGFGWASGRVGTAIGFDGTTNTGIALPDSILKGSQGSIALWLNAQALTDQNIIFSGKSTNDNNVYVAFIIDKDGRPTLQFRDSTNGNDRKAQGVKLMNKNEWYNVVFTANAQTYRIYINGEEVVVAGENIGRWFPDITNQTLSYRIGMLSATPLSGSWNGYLDDVRVYARALSQEDVSLLYNEGNNSLSTIPAGVAAKVNLTISEDHIPVGGSVALNWTTANVNSCSLTGDSSVTATSGTKVFIKISSDTSYTLSCAGKYGSAESTVKVVVGSTATPVATSSLVVVDLLNPTPPTPVVSKGNYSRNLTLGSRGDDVKQLQDYLIGKGFLSVSSTGYFGGLTKTGLIKLQKELGLPATGFFGPMTRGVLNK